MGSGPPGMGNGGAAGGLVADRRARRGRPTRSEGDRPPVASLCWTPVAASDSATIGGAPPSGRSLAACADLPGAVPPLSLESALPEDACFSSAPASTGEGRRSVAGLDPEEAITPGRFR